MTIHPRSLTYSLQKPECLRIGSEKSHISLGLLTPSPDAGRGKVAKDAKPRQECGAGPDSGRGRYGADRHYNGGRREIAPSDQMDLSPLNGWVYRASGLLTRLFRSVYKGCKVLKRMVLKRVLDAV